MHAARVGTLIGNEHATQRHCGNTSEESGVPQRRFLV